ncbi:MAG: Zinc carboxypeptidase [Acidobacteria bacterium]|nr:Zinc carboxypeptidase [Acidobacteriota bacterium]
MSVLVRRLRLAVVALLLCSASPRAGQAPPAGPPRDEEFARLVREWTTRPEFLSPLVDHLPIATGIPSPKDVTGHHVGEPKTLTYYDDILRYYRALAEATPRVKVIPIGTSDEGRPLVVVAISSAETIGGLEAFRSRLARLADPRGLSEADAAGVIAAAKPIYHVMAGLHSGEAGPPEMLMELAFRLAADEDPLFREIRENLIVTLTPVADPDGRDRYVDWYYAYKVDETGEDDSVGGPPYWGKYVLHDNNRDINYSQAVTRALLAWYLEWHPPVMHDIHESVPFLYTFSGQPPQNPSLDPILYAELPWFSNFEMAQAIKYGMPGVWTHAFVDMWSPGYFGFMASNHNGMLRMYEVFGNGGANTMLRKIDREDRGGPAGGQTTREWYRPLPPYKEVQWSLRNNVNYGETALLSALELAARFQKVLLENFYRKSRNAVDEGSRRAPYAFVIPAGQRDMTRVAFLCGVLRTQGVEIGRTRSAVTLKEGSIPAGSLVIRLDQPYGRLAKILLEKQDFPDPNLRTYDDSGWTMGLMTHAEVTPVADKAILDVALDPVDRLTVSGRVDGPGAGDGWIAALANGSSNLVTLRWELRDIETLAAAKAFTAGRTEVPAGSLLLHVKTAGERRAAASAIERLGLSAVTMAAAPAGPTHPVDLPRVAVFSTWGGTQEVGWVRYALDRFGVPYDLIFKERVRQGGLRPAFDVIVVPSQAGSARRLVFDVEPKSRPLAYRRTERFRNLGMYGESDDITGGMGLEGALELRRFVEQGGLLVTMGAASYFPPEFGLARKVEASRPGGPLYAPGPIVQVELLRPEHPIFYGYDKTLLPVRWANGPLLRVPDTDKRQVLMQFPGGDKSVLSGLMKGAGEVKDRPAALDVPLGDGRVLLFATNPCYRWQNLGEFNMLFNALLHWNDMGS